MATTDTSLYIPSVDGVRFRGTPIPSTDTTVMDAFKEGIWTPTFTFATPGNLAVTYALREGFYCKVGRIVYISARVTTTVFTHTTAAGSFTITGLPYATDATNAAFGSCIMGGWVAAGYTQLEFAFSTNDTQGTVFMSGSGVAVAIMAVGNVATGSNPNLRLGGWYLAAQ